MEWGPLQPWSAVMERQGLPRITYISVDPVTSTVGSSQVLAYVERLA